MGNRILLVEDEPAIQDLIRASIKAECRGVSVDTVTTVEEGARRLMKERYDAMILDLRLPDGDGLDVLRSLRVGFGKSACDIPIAVFTSAAPGRASDLMESRLASAFFNKTPQGLSQLCTCVGQTLSDLRGGPTANRGPRNSNKRQRII